MPDLSDCLVYVSIIIARPVTEKARRPITAEMMARHDEMTSADREKMLSGGDTGDRLAEVDDVLGAWLCRQLNTMTASLNATRCCTLSQCS